MYGQIPIHYLLFTIHYFYTHSLFERNLGQHRKSLVKTITLYNNQPYIAIPIGLSAGLSAYITDMTHNHKNIITESNVMI